MIALSGNENWQRLDDDDEEGQGNVTRMAFQPTDEGDLVEMTTVTRCN